MSCVIRELSRGHRAIGPRESKNSNDNHASFVSGNQEIEQRHPSNTAICSERSIAQFTSSVVIYQQYRRSREFNQTSNQRFIGEKDQGVNQRLRGLHRGPSCNIQLGTNRTTTGTAKQTQHATDGTPIQTDSR